MVFFFLGVLEGDWRVDLLVLDLGGLGGAAVGSEALLVEHVGFGEVFYSKGGFLQVLVFHFEAKPLEMLLGIGVGLDVQVIMPQILRSNVL